MLIPDLALARRLEFHEAWSSVEHARVQAELYPDSGAISLPAGGGYAVFCGQRSPLSQVYGAGLSGPVRARDLDAIEAFYHRRGRDARVRACPMADRSLLQSLSERLYRVQDFMNVYVRRVKAADSVLPAAPGSSIRVATLEEAQQWFTRVGAQGDWAEPEGVAFMTIRCMLKPGARLFLAWRDGRMLGGGALEVHAGVAALMADETLPAFRRQGIHTALLRARLATAVQAGCELAMVHTRPGAASERNVLRAGFQLAYTTAGLVRPRAASRTVNYD
jgi:GNAT superfamily N-acetyltransferase